MRPGAPDPPLPILEDEVFLEEAAIYQGERRRLAEARSRISEPPVGGVQPEGLVALHMHYSPEGFTSDTQTR
eukprot:COSAG01_NODE_67772_length_266_cov_0.610778_1_plen_71_part_01